MLLRTNMHMRALKLVSFALLITLISGCGWQMRGWEQYQANKGQSNVGLNSLKVSYESRDKSLYRSLLRVMKSQQVKESSDSDLELKVGNISRSRQPLTYSGASAPAQYELLISLNFSATKNGDTIIAPRPLVSRRNYDFDPNAIITKDQEERQLFEEMHEELALNMLLLLRQAQ